jgi:hypothetical protein
MAQTIDKEQVIATLRAHEQELKEAGVVRVRLFGSVFGSVARGDASEPKNGSWRKNIAAELFVTKGHVVR